MRVAQRRPYPVASIAVCLLAVLAAAACGGGSGGSSTSQPYRVSPVSSDMAYAKRVLVQIADLGVDWYPSRASESSDACLKAANPPATKTGDSGAPASYVEGSSLSVRSATDVYKTSGQAHAVMAAYRSPAYQKCYRAQVVKSLQSSAKGGSTYGAVQMTKLPVQPAGNETVAYRVTVPVTSGGTTLYFDLVGVRSGRAVARLVFGAEGGPFTGSEEQNVVNVIAARAGSTATQPLSPALTDSQLTFVGDLLDSYGQLHRAYYDHVNHCNQTSTSPTSWSSCIDKAYHSSGLLEKGRQMLVAIGQLADSTSGPCNAALTRYEARLKTEVSLEFRLHDAVSHFRGKSVIEALAKADDRNIPLMLSASDRVQAQCLGV